MRITAEGYQVYDHEDVYEILWAYYNDEVSEAFPHGTIPASVPMGFRIWKKKHLCQISCDLLNEANKKTLEKIVNNGK